MNTSSRAMQAIVVATALIWIGSVLSGRAHAQQTAANQPGIAKRLLSNIASERYEALAEATEIEPVQRGPALRSALIALLERQNKLVADARQRGLTIDQVEHPEFIAAVQRAVVELKDPASISALAGALGWFGLVQPLAEFGEQAAPAVLAVVMSPNSYYGAVDDALRILRFFVEKRQARPISAGTLAQIRRAAHQRLQGQQMFTTLWYAIDLASTLGDPDLRRTVEDLATYSSEIVARGITDPRLIEQTQKRATDRLAGIAALPRPK